MPDPELTAVSGVSSNAKLMAIVSVDHTDRVRCGQPTCGHPVYRRIHVVRENGKLLVLGSTCFANRYGTESALGKANFGGGEGRKLSAEESQLLMTNTEGLLARLEEEEARVQELVAKPVLASSQICPVSAPPRLTTVTYPRETPWEWVKPWSSVIYLKLRDGSGWIRAQRKDDVQLLVPWPAFDGWDEALPPLFGQVDSGCGGYALPDVVQALMYLRNHAEWETKPGRWKDVMTEIAIRMAVNS